MSQYNIRYIKLHSSFCGVSSCVGELVWSNTGVH